MVKIVVVGSYIVDLMSRTPHMPKPGETVLGGPFQMGPGGKGGNQAVAAARQGAQVTMVTKVGNDLFGEDAIRNFKQESIQTTYITKDEKEATGAALIAVDQHSENMIVVSLGACGKLTKEDVQQASEAFREADMILVQLETSIEAIQATIELANELTKPVVLNPAPYQKVDAATLSKVTFITPNETEASLLTGISVHDEKTAQAAAIKLYNAGISNVIITLGKKGCYVYDGNNQGRLIEGFAIDAVDSTGAGDAFNGGFSTFIASGMSIDEAVRKANAVAALSVTKVGTSVAMPTNEEVETFLETGF
ncbi:ribokinase [Halalkalibacter nanhaiisediminis]|uniref:Ribokinase n=1 Tax=Halalkalibacter nanhaiisediminis TaxID=688079 RepID=A0A562QN46_9BACI|nr:ribokinase [Halalkalibacter nanhaiisediminis]TWI58178.1 ribokinase [Halalkalibacter nanhaiisediminis]